MASSRRSVLRISGGLFATGLAGCTSGPATNAENTDGTTSTAESDTETTSLPTSSLTGSQSQTPTLADIDFPPKPRTRPDPRLFTGEQRIFLVNGYSTSFLWPDILQRKLNRYFDEEGVLTVEKAVHSNSPVFRWMDPDSGERKQLWQEKLSPALNRDDGIPVIVLAQQNIGGVFGSGNPSFDTVNEGIDGPDDSEDIERGANVLGKYASLLVEDGAAHVFIATHIYSEIFPSDWTEAQRRARLAHLGNQRLALAALVKRNPPHVSAGPDVFTPTKKHHPKAFKPDRIHPNQIGAEIMAHYWFKALLESDRRSIPPWSREEMEEAIKSASSTPPTPTTTSS